MSTQATPNTQPVKTKSKAYSSTVAIQGDAAKYRLKYKELKKKVREIETENEKLHFKTLRIKRNIQRMRLERAVLYERLEAETAPAAYRAPSHHYEGVPADHYPPTSHHLPPSAPTPSYAASYGAPSRSTPQAARASYGYDDHDDLPLAPPPRSHYGYGPPGPRESRERSPALSHPMAHPPPMDRSNAAADRSAALRQYTPSASPEEARELAAAGAEAGSAAATK